MWWCMCKGRARWKQRWMNIINDRKDAGLAVSHCDFLIRGNHTGLSCGLQSRFEELGCCRIWITSRTYLFQRCCSVHLTLLHPSSPYCCYWQACAAILFFMFLLVFSLPLLQVLARLPNVRLAAITTSNLTYDTFPHISFHFHQILSQFVARLEDGPYT